MGRCILSHGVGYSKLNKEQEAKQDLSEARRLGYKEPIDEY
jgi:hypothetical protein